jgi:hypothetical protein
LFGDVGIYTSGHVDDNEVSSRFAAMDITLSTFVDGVSSRRSSLMTAYSMVLRRLEQLAHHTDSLFIQRQKTGRCLLMPADVTGFAEATLRLMQDPDERERVAKHGHRLYEDNYALEGVAKRITRF